MEEKQLEQFGRVIDNIDVKISYKIIELFSAGLYSSPNKAFEELICNSYDAFASKVSVYLPEDLTEENAYIFVADNGEGLNQEEMKDNWIFLILVGKTVPNETQDSLFIEREVQRLERRIQTVEFENGISDDMAERILSDNYYMGMRVYRSLMANHTQRDRITIRYGFNEQLKISINDMEKEIEVLLPNFVD